MVVRQYKELGEPGNEATSSHSQLFVVSRELGCNMASVLKQIVHIKLP